VHGNPVRARALRRPPAVLGQGGALADTFSAPIRSTISSNRRSAGRVSFLADVATFQRVPSGASRVAESMCAMPATPGSGWSRVLLDS